MLEFGQVDAFEKRLLFLRGKRAAFLNLTASIGLYVISSFAIAYNIIPLKIVNSVSVTLPKSPPKLVLVVKIVA